MNWERFIWIGWDKSDWDKRGLSRSTELLCGEAKCKNALPSPFIFWVSWAEYNFFLILSSLAMSISFLQDAINFTRERGSKYWYISNHTIFGRRPKDMGFSFSRLGSLYSLSGVLNKLVKNSFGTPILMCGSAITSGGISHKTSFSSWDILILNIWFSHLKTDCWKYPNNLDWRDS